MTTAGREFEDPHTRALWTSTHNKHSFDLRGLGGSLLAIRDANGTVTIEGNVSRVPRAYQEALSDWLKGDL